MQKRLRRFVPLMSLIVTVLTLTAVSAVYASYWHDEQSAPNIAGYGSNWVIVEAPISDMETDREYCEVTHTRPDNVTVILDWGDVEYPFDGATFLLTNLASGTHTFTATALYAGDANPISRSVQITIQ